MGKSKAKIKVIENGPYIVSGDIPLNKEVAVLGDDKEPESWKQTESILSQGCYSLCRCGKSSKLPFCDGTHNKSGFDGTETANRKNFSEMSERIVGPELALDDAQCFCSIARFCHPGGDTWTLTEKSSDPAAKALAVKEACNCPSGRLVAIDKATGKPIEPELTPSISVTDDTRHKVSGPLWVKGGIQVEAADGYQYEVRNRVTLCCCGESKNKPFCNGAHIKKKYGKG